MSKLLLLLLVFGFSVDKLGTNRTCIRSVGPYHEGTPLSRASVRDEVIKGQILSGRSLC